MGRDRQRQPAEVRPQPRPVEATPKDLLLYLRQQLGAGQGLLAADYHVGGENCAVFHARQLLSRRAAEPANGCAGRERRGRHPVLELHIRALIDVGQIEVDVHSFNSRHIVSVLLSHYY